jgi:hypothetical protein
MAIDLTDLARVKAWRGISGSSKDAQILQLIPAISRRIERHVGRPDGFEQRERTETAGEIPEIPTGKVWGYTTLVAPIVSVASVKLDEDHSFGASATTLVEGEDFVVLKDQGRIEFDGYRPTRGHKTLQVVYTAGAATSTANLIASELYADLVQGATIQVAYALERINSMGATSENVNGNSRSQPAYSLLPDVVELLRPYIRRKLS